MRARAGQHHRIAQQARQVGGPPLRLAPLGERQQLHREAARPDGGLLRAVEQLPALGGVGVLGERHVAEDRGERVVEVVGDPARQDAQRPQLFLPLARLLLDPHLRGVAQGHQATGPAPKRHLAAADLRPPDLTPGPGPAVLEGQVVSGHGFQRPAQGPPQPVRGHGFDVDRRRPRREAGEGARRRVQVEHLARAGVQQQRRHPGRLEQRAVAQLRFGQRPLAPYAPGVDHGQEPERGGQHNGPGDQPPQAPPAFFRLGPGRQQLAFPFPGLVLRVEFGGPPAQGAVGLGHRQFVEAPECPEGARGVSRDGLDPGEGVELVRLVEGALEFPRQCAGLLQHPDGPGRVARHKRQLPQRPPGAGHAVLVPDLHPDGQRLPLVFRGAVVLLQLLVAPAQVAQLLGLPEPVARGAVQDQGALEVGDGLARPVHLEQHQPEIVEGVGEARLGARFEQRQRPLQRRERIREAIEIPVGQADVVVRPGDHLLVAELLPEAQRRQVAIEGRIQVAHAMMDAADEVVTAGQRNRGSPGRDAGRRGLRPGQRGSEARQAPQGTPRSDAGCITEGVGVQRHGQRLRALRLGQRGGVFPLHLERGGPQQAGLRLGRRRRVSAQQGECLIGQAQRLAGLVLAQRREFEQEGKARGITSGGQLSRHEGGVARRACLRHCGRGDGRQQQAPGQTDSVVDREHAL